MIIIVGVIHGRIMSRLHRQLPQCGTSSTDEQQHFPTAEITIKQIYIRQ